MRRPEERLGDLRAQMGAGRIAGRRLLELVERLELSDAGGDGCRGRLRRADGCAGDLRASRWGIPGLRLSRTRWPGSHDRRCRARAWRGDVCRLRGNFTTGRRNLNCPMPVTRFGLLLRAAGGDGPGHPRERGGSGAVHISAPEGCLVNARPPAAVAAGNVETSQRITDALLLALAQAMPLPGAGSGTMNNLTLGSEEPGSGFNLL